jgi:hypothetical protein
MDAGRIAAGNYMTGNKRSLLVLGAAWVLTLMGGYHLARAAYGNFSLAVMFESPGAMLSLANSTAPVELPPLARLAVEHIRLLFGFYFLLSLAVFITGLGLVLKKAWALSAFIWLCYLGAASCFIVLLFPGLAVPKPYTYEGLALTPEFNAAVARAKIVLRVIAVLFGAGAFWFGWRFERPDVRNEFAGSR